jgi:hypothetical protein
VLNQKKYNGKVDRLKLYEYLKEEWNKTPVVAKRTQGVKPQYEVKEWQTYDSTNDTQKPDKARQQYLQRVRNLTRPISHYKKL